MDTPEVDYSQIVRFGKLDELLALGRANSLWPLTFGLAVWMLRVLKAWLIGQQYNHRSTALDK